MHITNSHWSGRGRRWACSRRRRGGVYIVVLGSALIISLLGLSALVGQRIQNRIVAASADIRQAELNANTAVELALLIMKQEPDWRSNRANGNWFTGRGTGAGTCTVNVTDPLDGDLANNANDPVVVLGVGYQGPAQQRVRVTVDPQSQPLSSLRSAIAAGDAISLSSNALRTGGLITANSVSATSAQVYGNVEAVTVSGSTYNGTTTQINAGQRPNMPDWSTVFQYYRDNGSPIDIAQLATWPTINLGRNIDIENSVNSGDWTGSPPSGLGTATVSQSNNHNHTTGGTYSLRVQNRSDWYAGACQPIDRYVKPEQEYSIEAYVRQSSGLLKTFYVSIYTKGSGNGSPQIIVGPDTLALPAIWTKVSATISTLAWSGDLEYAFVKIAGDSNNTVDFYVDDLIIRETTTGRIIYKKVLSPSVNQLYTGAPTNPQGIYWIDCNGNRLIIERSRILGTLLVVNPGAGSCIGAGPIHWTPAVAGYPALLVHADIVTSADFAINATNRVLSEQENGKNFNPVGAPHSQFGEDGDANDIYPSEIRGLVAIEDDLSFSKRPLIRGQVLVGDDIANSSGELEVVFEPESLLNPPPGFLAPYSYKRRPSSVAKAVVP